MEINSIKSLQEIDKLFYSRIRGLSKDKVWKPESKSFMIC